MLTAQEYDVTYSYLFLGARQTDSKIPLSPPAVPECKHHDFKLSFCINLVCVKKNVNVIANYLKF